MNKGGYGKRIYAPDPMFPAVGRVGQPGACDQGNAGKEFGGALAEAVVSGAVWIPALFFDSKLACFSSYVEEKKKSMRAK